MRVTCFGVHNKLKKCRRLVDKGDEFRSIFLIHHEHNFYIFKLFSLLLPEVLPPKLTAEKCGCNECPQGLLT